RGMAVGAKEGWRGMVTTKGEKFLDVVGRAFHAAGHRHNRLVKLGQDMIWGAGIYLADTQDEAIRKCEAAHDERYKWFAPFGFVRYADEPHLGHAGRPGDDPEPA